MMIFNGQKVYVEGVVNDPSADAGGFVNVRVGSCVWSVPRHRIHPSGEGRIGTVRAMVADKMRHAEAHHHGGPFGEGYAEACRDMIRWLDSWLRSGR